MENASKALLIAAGVLLAIMVLTIGVYFYSSLSENTRSYINKLDATELTKYNAPFEVLLGRSDITAQEIVSIVEESKQKNKQIQVVVGNLGATFDETVNNMEEYDNGELSEFLNDNIQFYAEDESKLVYFKCVESSNPDVNGIEYDEDGRVIKIKFERVANKNVALNYNPPTPPPTPEPEPEPELDPDPNLDPDLEPGVEDMVTISYKTDPNSYPSADSYFETLKIYWSYWEAYVSKDVTEWKVNVPRGSTVRVQSSVPECEAGREANAVSIVFESWLPVPRGGYKTGKSYPSLSPGGSFVADDSYTLYASYAFYDDGRFIWDKPILYLYPTERTNINVKVGYPDRLTVSYPRYKENGWNVLAEPNGTLTDLTTNRELYCLYYEANNVMDSNIYKDGFIVKGEDSAEFLEEKLKILGLNEREAEEFIIYWLPKLESNKYNYIRFAEEEYINKNMPLDIQPKPDTIIRVLMEFKGIDKPFDIEEQKLNSPTREGYVVVEWGGVQLN